MMSLSARSAGGATSYYVHMDADAHRAGGEADKEDYYAREGTGRWHGAGARALGLHGDVTADAFSDTASGWSPTGEPLSQNAGDPDRRAGWDATFSAPKSVSTAWAVADESVRRAIEAAHDAAVSRALAYLQDHAIFSRRGSGGHRQERVDLVAAVFRHGASREQDPQLHSHVFLMNAGFRADGTWGTIESRHLYQQQKVAGAMYRAELASRLREQGYRVEADGDSFRISSVPRELEREFSTRRKQIEAALNERGVSGAKAAEAATLGTRRKKEERDPAALRAEWAERAAVHEYTHEQAGPEEGVQEIEPPVPTEVLEIATEHRAVLRETDLAYAAAVAAQHAGQGADQAEALVQQTREQAIELHDERGHIRYTSQELVDAERDVMRIATSGRDDTSHQLPSADVDAAIDRVAERAGYTLSDEQQSAVRHLAADSGRVAVLVGDAGTGKSTSMQAVREGYEAAGYQVLGAAPSGKAAAGLEESTGIKSHTIDSLLARVESGKIKLSDRTAIVCDEAGMVDSRKMAHLMRAADAAGSKVIMAGDPKQLQPVGAGATLRHLADDERGVGHARITEIHRQRDGADREAVRQLSRGEAAKAMLHYIDREQVSVRSTHKAAVNDVARKYLNAADEVGQERTVALASTNKRVEDINDRIREELKSRGELTAGREFQALREQDRDRKTGETRTTTEQAEYATGDRVVYAGTNDYKDDIRRGDLGTVVGVGEDGLRVRLDRDPDRIREIDPRQADVRHGYAITTHRAQGATVARAVVYASSDISREQAYVQGSRARDATEWVTTRHTVKTMSAQVEREAESQQPQKQQPRQENDQSMRPEERSMDPRLIELRDVVQAMSRSRPAESTLDYKSQHKQQEMATQRGKTSDLEADPESKPAPQQEQREVHERPAREAQRNQNRVREREYGEM